MGIIGLITNMDRRVFLLAAVAFVLVMLGFFAFIFIGGDEEADEAGLDLLPEEEMIAVSDMDIFVQATISASVPTSTPEPTPDVPATVAAEMANMRESTGAVIELGPLDLGRADTPFLSPEDLDYLEKLGPPMWAHAQVWLLLREVLRVEHVYWRVDDLSRILKEIKEILLSPEAQFNADQFGVSPLVLAYGEEVQDAFESMREAARRMEEAESLLRDMSMQGILNESQADRLLIVENDVNSALWEYHRTISRYGCSVCGELFRAVR